jgi:uncharacterized damage-inducible protein DinB
VNDLRTMTRYKAWADERFFDAVRTLPEAEVLAPRTIVFGSLIRTLNHAYAMDHVWRCHLHGEAHGMTTRNPETHPPLDALIRAQRDIDAWYVAYADGLSEAQAEEAVDFEFIGGGAGRMARREIVLHVVNHTTYHRGHVATMLYDLGVFPPATDLPVFLREWRAAEQNAA